VQLLGDRFPDRPVLDMAVAHAVLRRVAEGELPPTLRVYRPGPTMAFGRLDALRPGFAAACEAARAHGYEPVLRLGGGHAAAYDDGSVVFDHFTPQATVADGLRDRFADGAELVAEALRDLGLPAAVGELPGEYCPGAWSVHAAGVKLGGTAQRTVRGAALLTGFVVAANGARIRAALTDVYARLGLEWDPATAGAAEDVAPGVGPGDVARALIEAHERRAAVTGGRLDDATLALARRLEARHRCDVGR
jgi:octanoyl-[GcvH]:protein N-octanoyltransferase